MGPHVSPCAELHDGSFFDTYSTPRQYLSQSHRSETQALLALYYSVHCVKCPRPALQVRFRPFCSSFPYICMTRPLLLDSTSKHGWPIVYTLTCSQQEPAGSRKRRHNGHSSTSSLPPALILCKILTGIPSSISQCRMCMNMAPSRML